MSESNSTPLDWIRLELVPLPGTEGRAGKMVWWNPEQRIIEGEGAQEIIDLAASALANGSMQTGSGAYFEIDDPLHQPSQLAAVLAQYYWVIPQPVAESGQMN